MTWRRGRGLRGARKQVRSPTETCPGTMTMLRSPRRTRSGWQPRRRPQPGIQDGSPLASATGRRTRPGARVQLIRAQRHRGLPDTRGPGDQSDPAMPQRTGLGPISSHRCRSSRCGKIVSNFATRISLVASMLPIPHQHAAFQEATGYFPASPMRH